MNETNPATQHILIVEDESPIRFLLGAILSRVGYRVSLAVDGKAALAILGDGGAGPDLLVTDMRMPDMDGPELCVHARRYREGIAILLCSGLAVDANLLEQLGDGGPAAYLGKPFMPRELIAGVRQLLDAAALAHI